MPEKLLETASPAEAWVYLHLIRLAGGESQIEASLAEIAGATGYAKRWARATLQRLASRGLIAIEEQQRASGASERKVYRLGEARKPPMPKPKPKKPADPRAIPPFPPELDTPEFRAAVEAWTAQRTKLRHRQWLTETWEIHLRRWAGWGVDRAVAALRHSTEQEYQGVFEPKGKVPAPTPFPGIQPVRRPRPEPEKELPMPPEVQSERWEAIAARLRRSLTPEEFTTWIAPLRVRSESGDGLVLVAPNSRFVHTIEENYRTAINTAAGSALVSVESLAVAR